MLKKLLSQYAIWTFTTINSKDKNVHAEILKAADNPNKEIRLEAIKALSKIALEDEKVQLRMVSALQDPVVSIREIASIAFIKKIKTLNESVLPALVKALTDDAYYVSNGAFASLTNNDLSDKKLQFELLNIMSNSKKQYAKDLAFKLLIEQKITNPNVQTALLDLFKKEQDGSGKSLQYAADIIKTNLLGNKSVVSKLVKMINAKDKNIRVGSINLLSYLPKMDESLQLALVSGMYDLHSGAAAASALSLQKILSTGVVKSIAKLIDSKNPRLQLNAISVFRYLDADSVNLDFAAAALKDLRQSPNQNVQKSAKEAYGLISDKILKAEIKKAKIQAAIQAATQAKQVNTVIKSGNGY